jgi:hypothetical protein
MERVSLEVSVFYIFPQYGTYMGTINTGHFNIHPIPLYLFAGDVLSIFVFLGTGIHLSFIYDRLRSTIFTTN